MSSFQDNFRGIPVHHKCGLNMPFYGQLTPDEGVEDSLVISYPPPIRPQSKSELCSPGVLIEKRRFQFGNHRLLIHARFGKGWGFTFLCRIGSRLTSCGRDPPLKGDTRPKPHKEEARRDRDIPNPQVEKGVSGKISKGAFLSVWPPLQSNPGHRTNSIGLILKERSKKTTIEIRTRTRLRFRSSLTEIGFPLLIWLPRIWLINFAFSHRRSSMKKGILDTSENCDKARHQREFVRSTYVMGIHSIILYSHLVQ